MTKEFDYIIFGAGSVGCILADRLTEGGAPGVCRLEAGPPDRNPFIHVPAGFIKTLVNLKINWLYQAGLPAGTGGRATLEPRGKTLRGSNSINGHIHNRGHRLGIDGWALMVGHNAATWAGDMLMCTVGAGPGPQRARSDNGSTATRCFCCVS